MLLLSAPSLHASSAIENQANATPVQMSEQKKTDPLDPKIIALFLGAFLGLVSSQVLKIVERRDERKSLASAFAGEINAILEMGEYVKPTMAISEYLSEIKVGKDVELPLVIRDIKFEEVYKANVGKLGLMGDDLPERLASFYTYLFNLRGDLGAVERGEYKGRGPEATEYLVEQNLKLWIKLERAARDLVVDLRKIAGYTRENKL